MYVRATAADIFATVDHMTKVHGDWKAKRCTQRFSEETCLACGLTYAPDGILWDHEVRVLCDPESEPFFDPMHIYFSQGLGQLETTLTFKKLLRTTTWNVETICEFRSADSKVRSNGPIPDKIEPLVF